MNSLALDVVIALIFLAVEFLRIINPYGAGSNPGRTWFGFGDPKAVEGGGGSMFLDPVTLGMGL